jgi:hypothetical protein
MKYLYMEIESCVNQCPFYSFYSGDGKGDEYYCWHPSNDPNGMQLAGEPITIPANCPLSDDKYIILYKEVKK